MAAEKRSGTVRLVPKDVQQGMQEEYELKGDQTTIGRHPSNDIILALDSISRFHARIDRRGDYYILQDLNSSNGSMVNGDRVTQVGIHHGDLVTFGNVEFKFVNEADREESALHSYEGKDIVDFEDDADRAHPSTQSFVKAEDVADKSSVISSVADKKIDKATLYKLNQRLSSLYRLSELMRELDTERQEFILQRVLDVLFLAIPAADRGVILTRYHRESEEFDVSAVKYRDEPIVPHKVRVSRTILNQVLDQRIAVLSRDAQVDDRFQASESIIVGEIRSTICAPMILSDSVIGVIHLDSTRETKAFEQDDLEFAMIVATEIGVALSNARMQREAAHRERLAAVGETVSGISHNVKNILLLSQGGAELLTRALNKDDVESAKEAWQVVSRGIDKIGKLVREMLDYSSHRDPELTEVDINEMICTIAEEIEDQLVAKGVTLELDLEETLEPRMLDEDGLQRTLMNLIVNGMEAITHQEGEILVSSSRRDDDGLVITVRDNGTGIPEEKRERIFYPFFTTKGSSGTGLGLPMCKKCIEEMGGTIEVHSEENVGTTFVIEIPPQKPAEEE